MSTLLRCMSFSYIIEWSSSFQVIWRTTSSINCSLFYLNISLPVVLCSTSSISICLYFFSSYSWDFLSKWAAITTSSPSEETLAWALCAVADILSSETRCKKWFVSLDLCFGIGFESWMLIFSIASYTASSIMRDWSVLLWIGDGGSRALIIYY